MKRVVTNITVGLMMGLMLLTTACSRNGEREEYWMSYDGVALMSAPSDTATVMKQLRGRTSPFIVTGRDSTDQWGCYEIQGGLFSKTKQGWLPLTEMIYAGSDDAAERYEAYVVVPKEVPVYKHAQQNKKDRHGKLHSGDTVLATAWSGNWLHIYYTHFGRAGRQREVYGWVQTAQLQRIDPMSRDSLREQMFAKSVISQADSREDAAYLQSRQRFHTTFRLLGTVIGYLAMALALGLFIFAVRRNKMLDVVALFLMGLLILVLWRSLKVPVWWLSLLIPLMAYVLCYPLLYSDRTSRLFGILFPVVSLLAATLYLLPCTNLLHPTLVRVLWFLVLIGVCLVETLFLRKRRMRDVCPHCGHYAKHAVDERRQTGETTRYGTEKKNEYVNTTRETQGSTEHIARHYNRVTYDTEKTTRIYEVGRTCMSCGRAFTNREETTSTTKTKRD